eukprot:CAMPEP_0184865032 /NCGR_PEP_ID=MMETSP0580-20130426/16720_1 /TAXON_ID=1118495 /ORGANISM="Dactyliosolen fragilissimus" /LENGTH=287 /DNA_ID=CAMNT_0027364039 /DNA_START=12 /DNA_END=876 /DNA_ORIENTATION=+
MTKTLDNDTSSNEIRKDKKKSRRTKRKQVDVDDDVNNRNVKENSGSNDCSDNDRRKKRKQQENLSCPNKNSHQNDAKDSITNKHKERTHKKINNNNNNDNNNKNNKPLNGLTLAISTLDVVGKKHTNVDSSYRSVTDECVSLGASVTGQVHKRIFAVICNQSALNQLTQRVRKAVKKSHLLVDVEWIRECKNMGYRVNHDTYILNEKAKSIMKERNHQREKNNHKNDDDIDVHNHHNKTCDVEFMDNEPTKSQNDEDLGWTPAVIWDAVVLVMKPIVWIASGAHPVT